LRARPRREAGHLLLAEAEPGSVYIVASVYERDSSLAELLDQRGIRPGSELHLDERNYDQTLSLNTPAGAVVLGRPAAEKIWVVPLPNSASSHAKKS